MRDRFQKVAPGFIWLIAIFTFMILHVGALGVKADESIQQVEGLNRVGPMDPTFGYPLWYEDKNGLKLTLCVDLNNCFIEPPDPTLPLSMPTNFPDESFYFAAESIFHSSTVKGHRAVLIQALEAIFFSDAGVIAGDQAVMSRIRLRVDGLIEGEEYTVIYPYGKHNFIAPADAGVGAAKGPGLSFVRDIGLTGPLEFDGPLDGDIGPFLTSTGYAGGPFIGDGATETTITGSPLGTNVFRIEGPKVGKTYPEYRCADMTPIGLHPLGPDDCVESFLFSIMGKVTTQVGVTIDSAIFDKIIDASDQVQTSVNIWASTIEGQKLVATIDGGPAWNLTEGVDGNYFGRFSVPSDTLPQEIRLTNITDDPPFFVSTKITDKVTIRDATYTIGSGLSVTAESSNQVDLTSMTAYPTQAQTTKIQAALTPLSFPLTDQGNGLASGIMIVDEGLEEQPAFNVVVKSSGGGGVSAEADVNVSGPLSTGGPLDGVVAIAGLDQTVNAKGQTVFLDGSYSLGLVDLSYIWTHDDTSGLITLTDPNSAQTEFLAPPEDPPLPGGILVVNFTLTVSDGVNSNSNTMTVTMVQKSALPVDTCVVTQAFYRENKERWVVEGGCDMAENQVIEVWLGNDTEKMLLIGKTVVDASGLWLIDTGNGGAADEGSIPDPTIHTKIHVISSRGFESILSFDLK